MRVPERLEPLLDHGVIEEVLRPLMSGKEADVYVVRAGGYLRVAKVYKNAQFRSFQHRAEYTEGRRVRSSREQRAMNKRSSRHGRAKTEEAWQSTEVDAIYRLRSAGVRVPEPIAFSEGVLVMELITGPDGEAAPRLVDLSFRADEAFALFHVLLREVVKMLCAGVVHADLSDFNILMSSDGPVVIDFPQVVDPAANQSAGKLLKRDVANLTSFLARYAPQLRGTQYGPEMWDLYERSELDPDTELTGKFVGSTKKAEVNSLLEDILELEEEAREARERRNGGGLEDPMSTWRPEVRETAQPKKSRVPKPPKAKKSTNPNAGRREDPPPVQAAAPENPGRKRSRRRKKPPGDRPRTQQAGPRGPSPAKPKTADAPNPAGGDAPKKRRRRRKRRGGGGGPGGSPKTD